MDSRYIRKVYPDISLQDYIQAYTFIDIPFEYAKQMDFLVMPSSHSRIVLFFSEPSLEEISGKFQKVESNSLSGLYSRPHLFLPTESLKQVIIQFTPWGIQPFLDFPLSDITDSRADLETVFKYDLEKLLAELYKAKDLYSKQHLLNIFFNSRLLKTNSFDERIKPIVEYICNKHGNLKLSQLSKNIFIGERTIQRLIHNSIGVNYKFFAKLVRIEHVRKLLNNGNTPLNEIPHSAGYYDQAHFIHEFQSVYSQSPSMFIKRQKKMVWNHLEATQDSSKK